MLQRRESVEQQHIRPSDGERSEVDAGAEVEVEMRRWKRARTRANLAVAANDGDAAPSSVPTVTCGMGRTASSIEWAP